MSPTMFNPPEECLSLAHQLGVVPRDLVVAAEGNVSARLDDNHFVISASGTALRTLAPSDLVRVRTGSLLRIVASNAGDLDVAAGLAEARDPAEQPTPSVESLLHAVCYQDPDISFIAHTHPTAVNGVLCSDQAEALVDMNLYPDQVVVMGRARLLLPYIDPGLQLARAMASRVREFTSVHGASPRVIYAANHGVFALGRSAAEALAISEMANKTARVLLAAWSVGRPVFMSDADVERIDSRGDEQERRLRLRETNLVPGSR